MKKLCILIVLLLLIVSCGRNNNDDTDVIYEPELAVAEDITEVEEIEEYEEIAELEEDSEDLLSEEEITDVNETEEEPEEELVEIEETEELEEDYYYEETETEAPAVVRAPLSDDPFVRYTQVIDFLTNYISAVDTDVTIRAAISFMGMQMMDESVSGNLRLTASGVTTDFSVSMDTSEFGGMMNAEELFQDLTLDMLFLAPLIDVAFENASEMTETGGLTTINVTFGTQDILDGALNDILIGFMLGGLLGELDNLGLGSFSENITITIGNFIAQAVTDNEGVPLSKSTSVPITIIMDGIPLVVDISMGYVFNSFDF